MNTAPPPQTAPCPLRQFLNDHAPASFDVPCACGHISDQCTQREDGTCDG